MATKVVRSMKDTVAVNLLRLSSDKKLRYAWKKCIISSPTLVAELSRRYTFEDIILDKRPKSELPYDHKNLTVVSPKLLERIGQLKNSRAGILATLPIPAPLSLESFEAKHMLVLDGIDDVGELGTMLRSACAFGWQAVWITHTCADPFDPVCIRASQGALFDLPYRVGSIENALKHARRSKGIAKLLINKESKVDGRIGIIEPDIGESSLFKNTDGSICLLVQRTQHDSPRATDFRSIDISGMADPSSMSLAVTASTLMLGIRDRYFR